ncbi:hypothetical protein RHOSPDRAFT_34981 [Rhodotorula sp. JG-1b]|nr:hypothetical protein RHOSPDRAFT_34981 [Rhodotorula sp. JG-1b]
MAEALMLRAPTSRLATQIRSHARVLASLKLRPAPGEYTCAAALQPRPTQDRAERDYRQDSPSNSDDNEAIHESTSSTSTDGKHGRPGNVSATPVKTCRRPLRRAVFVPGRQQPPRSRTVRKVPDRGHGLRAEEGGMQLQTRSSTKMVSASDVPTCAREQLSS